MTKREVLDNLQINVELTKDFYNENGVPKGLPYEEVYTGKIIGFINENDANPEEISHLILRDSKTDQPLIIEFDSEKDFILSLNTIEEMIEIMENNPYCIAIPKEYYEEI